MKPIITFFLLTFSSITYSQDVNIPDQNFLNFLISNGYDLNGDGTMQQNEVDLIDSLNVSYRNLIKSIDGIQEFDNLVYLNILGALQDTFVNWNGSLKHLEMTFAGVEYMDISQQTNLEVLKIYNSISLNSINFNNPNLKILELSNLSVEDLDLTSCINLQELIIPQLIYLRTIDLSGLSNIKKLVYYQTNIAPASIDIEPLTKLEYLELNTATSNITFDTFNINHFPNINHVNITGIKSPVIIANNHNNITTIEINNNETFTELHINDCDKLLSVSIDNRDNNPFWPDLYKVKGVAISNCQLLDDIQLKSIRSKSLDFTIINNPNLSTFLGEDLDGHTSSNLTNKLILDNSPKINIFNLSSHDFDTVKIMGLNNLTELVVFGNKPSVIEFNNFNNIETFGVNILSDSLSLLDFPKLKHANLSGPFRKLSLGKMDSLESFKLSNVELTHLHVKGYPKLNRLEFENIFTLKSLHLENLNYLRSTDILRLTNLDSLEISNCNNIQFLEMANLNRLKTIRFNTLKLLETLELSRLDSLTSLHIDSCDNLTRLKLSHLNYDFSNFNFDRFKKLQRVEFSYLSGLNQLSFLNKSFGTIWLRDIHSLNEFILNKSSASNLIVSNCYSLNKIDLKSSVVKETNFDRIISLNNFIIDSTKFTNKLTINRTIIKNLNLSPQESLKTITINNNDSLKIVSLPQSSESISISSALDSLIIHPLASLNNLEVINTKLNTLNLSDINFNSRSEIAIQDNSKLKNVYFKPLLDPIRITRLQIINNNQLRVLDLTSINPETLLFNSFDPIETVCVNHENHNLVSIVLVANNIDAEILPYCDRLNSFGIRLKPILNTTENIDVPIFKIIDRVNRMSHFLTEDFHTIYFPSYVDNIELHPIVIKSDLFSIEPNPILYDTADLKESNLDSNRILHDTLIISNKIDIYDLSGTIIPIRSARPGFDAKYKLIYRNNGTIATSGEFELQFPNDVLDFISASQNPSNMATGALKWDFNDLQPFEERSIEFTMHLNSPMDAPPLNGGDLLNYSLEILPVDSDYVKEDNFFILRQRVVNSYDPNDKRCLQGDRLSPDMVGSYLTYMIRFENTGTASAIHVRIEDEIDTSVFDISTIEPTDASHEYEMRIHDGNLVEFRFDSIMLPHEDAYNDGYVSFRIKTKDNLVLGEKLKNKASIFFDFNFPIVTNYATTEIKEENPNITIKRTAFKWSVFPNPTKDQIFIESEEDISELKIYDLKGTLLYEVKMTYPTNFFTYELDDLTSGQYIIKVSNENGEAMKKIVIE